MDFLVCARCGNQMRTPGTAEMNARLTCRRCGSQQSFARKEAAKPWQRAGPYTLACGCDSQGGRCEVEGLLYGAIEAASRAILAGVRCEGVRTEARAAYHAHFNF